MRILILEIGKIGLETSFEWQKLESLIKSKIIVIVRWMGKAEIL